MHPDTPSSYKPISLLPFYSEVLENYFSKKIAETDINIKESYFLICLYFVNPISMIVNLAPGITLVSRQSLDSSIQAGDPKSSITASVLFKSYIVGHPLFLTLLSLNVPTILTVHLNPTTESNQLQSHLSRIES